MPRLENAHNFRKSKPEDLFAKAKEVVDKEMERSQIFDPEAVELLPHFDLKEVLQGRVVGRGGFCVVKECVAIKLAARGDGSGSLRSRDILNGRSLRPTTSSLHSGAKNWAQKLSSSFGASAHSRLDLSMHSTEDARQHLARRVWSKRGGKYVVKQVEPELIHADRVTYLKGVIDLALETYYLASLAHPHILTLVGLSKQGFYEDMGYFLILDQLQETLSKRLNAWMQTKRTTKGITGAITGGRRKISKLLTERLLVAYDIADAMDYLHSKQIIYRDLKPDNLGFDYEGTLKIFDFGLAKELQESERTKNGLYHMTGFTGAIRYMAPEVGLKEPYNLKADVYSWSMILWYIMALEPPMGLYTPKMFMERVHKMGYRPMIKERKWPAGVNRLMKISWSDDINERPSFSQIKAILRKELTEIDPELRTFFSDDSEYGEDAKDDEMQSGEAEEEERAGEATAEEN